MSLFSRYEEKLIRVTDQKGNVYTGLAETFPAEYGLHEYGRGEDGLQIGEHLFFESQIVKAEILPDYDEAVKTILPGRYRHFKGREYEVLGIARNSETEEAMVVYRALYGEGGLWVRPADMWNEIVERDGIRRRRFEKI